MATIKKRWIVLALFTLVLFFGALFFFTLYLVVPRPTPIQAGSVLEVRLAGTVRDLPSPNPLASLLESGEVVIWNLSQALERAKTDNLIQGVAIELGPLAGWGWGHVEEIRDHISNFRESGKPVHVLINRDLIGEMELYLASSADQVVATPGSGLILDGLMAELVYYQRALTKLGVEAHFIQFKEYKSAAEVYQRRDMSEPVREMYRAILSDIENRFISTISEERSVPEDVLRETLTRGVIGADQALSIGLLDRVADAHAFYSSLLSEEDPSEGDRKRVSVARYSEVSAPSSRNRNRVALVGALGTIVTGPNDPFGTFIGGSSFASILRTIRLDDRFKGVIFRVDSPGGAVAGSEMIWQEVVRLREAGKPVVISMSSVAASGGYFISMAADRIICQPSAITGSVGVFFGKFNIKGLYDWLGMDVQQVKISPNPDTLSPFSGLQPAQEASLRQWIGQTYDDFVEKAAEGRGQTSEEFEPKARGRVYTGAMALENGLVDELGGFSQAVTAMKELLQLDSEEELLFEIFPKPKSLWESLSSGELLKLQSRLERSWVERELGHLATPRPWFMAPRVNIH